jgi:hypothetical protein
MPLSVYSTCSFMFGYLSTDVAMVSLISLLVIVCSYFFLTINWCSILIKHCHLHQKLLKENKNTSHRRVPHPLYPTHADGTPTFAVAGLSRHRQNKKVLSTLATGKCWWCRSCRIHDRTKKKMFCRPCLYIHSSKWNNQIYFSWCITTGQVGWYHMSAKATSK